jgi:hypothetical protein
MLTAGCWNIWNDDDVTLIFGIDPRPETNMMLTDKCEQSSMRSPSLLGQRKYQQSSRSISFSDVK